MKIGLLDITTFTDSIRTVNDLVTEASIKVGPHGVEIISMDPANVCMIILRLSAKEFMELRVDGELETLDVKLSELKQVLGRLEKGASATIENVDNRLKITSLSKNGKKKEFSIPLIEVEKKNQSTPNLDKFKAEILVDNTELKDAIADVEIVSESFEVKVEDSKFVISATGELSKARTEVVAMIVAANDTKARSKYSIEYFNKFTNTKMGKSVKVQLGTDYPISLTYANDKGSSLQFILAPRIENN